MMPASVKTEPRPSPALSPASTQLPSFFIVGPPRTGTSWIHHVLQRSANLPNPTKETRFFDCHQQRGLSWYLKHFPALLPERPTGEVAPTYFASSQARAGIAQMFPDAKLVFIFREPVQRIVSLYRVKCAYGLLNCSFEEALHRDPELLASAQYATQLQKWLMAFPAQQTLVTLYDDLCKSPQEYINRLHTFLGIPPRTLTASELRYVHSSQRLTQPRNYVVTCAATAVANWCKARNLDHIVAAVRNSQWIELFMGGGNPFPEIPPGALKRISETFRPEIDGLQQLIARDLSMWSSETS